MELNGYIKALIFLAALSLLYCLFIVIFRWIVYSRVKKACKKKEISFSLVPNFLSYLLGQKKKVDFKIGEDTAIKVVVIGRRKCRFHLDDESAYLFFAKRHMYSSGVMNSPTRKISGGGTIHSTFRIKNAIKALKNADAKKKVIVLFPPPKEVSVLRGNGMELISAGEQTEKGIIVHTLQSFIKA